MKFRYDESAERWLEDHGFNETERGKLLELLNRFEKDMAAKGKKLQLLLPKDTSDKIAAMVALLDSVEDVEGRPACFTPECRVVIPDEARALYSEGMGIQEMERTILLAEKAKQSRGQMDSRRRGSPKG